MSEIENALSGFGFKFTTMLVVIVIIIWQMVSQQSSIARLSKLHAEPFSNNPYAARLPTIVDSGITSNTVLGWGNAAGGRECPSMEEANSYLATPGMDYYSNFLGGPEPPVFYNIGDVQKTRDTRDRSQGGLDGSVSKYGNGVSYEARQVPYTDSQGNSMVRTEYVPCRSARYVINSDGKCALPAGMTEAATFHNINEAATFHNINESYLGKKFQTDSDLMGRY